MSGRPLAIAAMLIALLTSGTDSPVAQEALPAQGPTSSGLFPSKPASDRNGRRLLQRFAEDAAVIPGGWVEGQYVYQNLPDGSSHSAGAVVAFKIAADVEAGLRLGIEHLRPERGPSETGISDIDLYAKYRLPGGTGRFALGALAKAATADQDKHLGTGKADYEIFGAYRADLEAVTLVANAGIRFNGQPDPPAQSSKDSFLLGGGVLLPATQRLTFVIEGTFESKRFEGEKDDGRLTLGFQSYCKGRRGGLRGGIGLPLTDGAPDLNLIFGAFLTY